MALTTGGNIETETIAGFLLEQLKEAFADEIGDVVVPVGFITDAELAELLDDLTVLEVNTNDLVIVAAAFDGGPFDDRIGGGAEGIAHVGLLVNFLGTGTGLAIDDEFLAGKITALSTIDNVEETEFDGIGH